ncbi:TPA: restriction system-associated AAA family ATPase [Stenotrophomonas maltophilia]|nr:restriction system-associated AAA family ATPase [Stenotrophomonas maltophilia]
MKLLRVRVIAAQSCGGLLDGLDVRLRDMPPTADRFEPLCLIGPNGAGKSQFIQVVAEAFQSIFHACLPKEERGECNPDLQFEIEYLVVTRGESVHVRASRVAEGRRRPPVRIARLSDGDWVECDLADPITAELLPAKIIGYTSGANETLSLAFLVSRAGYADEVAKRALNAQQERAPAPDSRLMLIDYGTHLEVLVANLLLGTREQHQALLEDIRVDDLNSFRCVIQLAHSAVRAAPSKKGVARKGIQLTKELESYIQYLQACATAYHHDEKSDTYTFDFLVTGATRESFAYFWSSSLELYAAIHKIAMLNDLAIPRVTRTRFRKDTLQRKFASRLPEPQDEEKVFRFERVEFRATGGKGIVDYVSLSDGEHQMAQLIGTMSMVSFPNVLFLFDEPESHFNPQWRVKLLSRVLSLKTANGSRSDASPASLQDGLLTTHSPFVASDMRKERVLIFRKHAGAQKIEVRNPDIETFGTTFDAILAECFGIEPPISDLSMARIDELNSSEDPAEIQRGMAELGDSIEKIMLADRLRQLKRKGD